VIAAEPNLAAVFTGRHLDAGWFAADIAAIEGVDGGAHAGPTLAAAKGAHDNSTSVYRRQSAGEAIGAAEPTLIEACFSLEGANAMADDKTGRTALPTRELYQSANGDRWCLARDPSSGRVFVEHEPNLASGDRTARIEIGAFLSRGGQGPEHQELLRLIGMLVET
jgi:hypothetical protein